MKPRTSDKEHSSPDLYAWSPSVERLVAAKRPEEMKVIIGVKDNGRTKRIQAELERLFRTS